MGTKEKQSIRGRAYLVLKDSKTGRVLEERIVENAVMAGGNLLLAKLFCGDGPSKPISHVGVGTDGTDSNKVNLEDLKIPVTQKSGSPDRVPIQDVEVTGDADTGSAKVKFSAVFGEEHGNGELKEAGIFNGTTGGVLYNRITFAAVNKADNHALTLVWEVVFSGTSPQGQ